MPEMWNGSLRSSPATYDKDFKSKERKMVEWEKVEAEKLKSKKKKNEKARRKVRPIFFPTL